MEPAAKKAKTEEAQDVKSEPELEKDAASDSRPKLKDTVAFNTPDTTMNVMPTTFGNMLAVLSDGGMQYLLAGARANTGVKSGRYMFEAKIVELHSLPANATPLSHSYARVGVSTEGSSLILGETEDSVCFDTEGSLISNKSKTPLGFTFAHNDIVAVVLNLDDKSTNSNTISLFVNGKRACKPQALPADLKGKVLHPTFTYRNLTLHYNFGPAATEQLPFTCRMLQDAASKDVSVTTSAKPLDGKYEALFPICLPDEGTFQWLDMFLEKNPHYTELTDRAILDWADKSGLARQKGYQARTSNDKPDMSAQSMEDMAKALRALAAIQPRNYVVLEVKSNLLKADRKALLEGFASPDLKPVALVLVGEPPSDFKKRTLESLLAQKQETSDAEFNKKLDEQKRQRQLEKRQKDLERMKRKSEKQAKKAVEERKRKLEAELKKGTSADEEKKEEEEGKMDDDSDEAPDTAMDEPDPSPPKVALTAEEKKLWFKKGPVMDLSASVHATNFTKFSLPDKEEGFDEIRHDWSKPPKSNETLRTWVQDRKLTTRVEDAGPGDWFSTKSKDWQKLLQHWHSKQNEYKNTVAKKAADRAAKAQAKANKLAEKEAAEKAAALKAQAAAAAAIAAAANGEPADEKKEEELKDFDEEEEKEEPEEKEEQAVDFEKLDVFGVEDILNIGGSPAEPLFSKFQFEDWTMMSLRYELNLLAHSFRKDVNDADRIGIYMEHLPFYYQKYFKKALTPKFYGVESLKDLLDLIRDTIVINPKNQCLEPQLPEELESQGLYVMLVEEARRERQRRLDLGDKTAALNVQQNAGTAAALYMASQNAQRGPPPTMTIPAQVVAARAPIVGGGMGGGMLGPGGMRPMQPLWQQQQMMQAPWGAKGGMAMGMQGGIRPAWQQQQWRPNAPAYGAPTWKGR